MTEKIDRRSFVQSSGSAVLSIGLTLPLISCDDETETTSAPTPTDLIDHQFNAWLKISTDDVVTLLCPQSEMGQGIHTAFAQIVADELGADIDQVKIQDVTGKPYVNPAAGFQQMTASSSSVIVFYEMLIRGAAQAREVLVETAAERWNVSDNDCDARDGKVRHLKTGRAIPFGELVEEAAMLMLPEEPELRRPNERQYIGAPVKRLDTPSKVDGSAVFGIDVRMPGMVYAALRMAPTINGRLGQYDLPTDRELPGLIATLLLENAVAVVAETYWQARTAADALDVKFEGRRRALLNDDAISATLTDALSSPTKFLAQSNGNIEEGFRKATRILEADYAVPYLAHMAMEPINCTAHVTQDKCEVWAPTQNQAHAITAAAEASGLEENQVVLHTTLIGGSFGRRIDVDYVSQTVTIAKVVERPVQLIWTREQDVKHDFPRPAGMSRHRAGLDEDGNITAWHQSMSGSSLLKRLFPNFIRNSDFDVSLVAGAINDPPPPVYEFENRLIDAWDPEINISVGFWRSTAPSANIFLTECFMDELAYEAGADPYEFRRAHLGPRAELPAVIDLAAEKSNWGAPLPEGWGRGIAIGTYAFGYVAQVAEVSVDAAGAVRVERVVTALDCGRVINPDIVQAQIEGGTLFGVSAALGEELNVRDGEFAQSNFHDYRVLGIVDAPLVELHLVDNDRDPAGAGELGTPCVMPAIANAIFDATGIRIRSLPVSKHDLRRA